MRRAVRVAWLLVLLLTLLPARPANAAAPPTWRVQEALPQITDVAYGNGRYVALAWGGGYLLSTDGKQWAVRKQEPSFYAHDIIFREGLFRAATDGGMMTSSDGESWTKGTYLNAHILDWAAGNYWAAGPGGLWRSADHKSWRRVLKGEISQAAWSGRQWLAYHAEEKAFYRSVDGEQWAQVPLPTGWRSLIALAGGNGRFVALVEEQSGAGQVMTSEDGIAWTKSPMKTGRDERSISFASGRFWVLGHGGKPYRKQVFSSVDGTTWEGAPLPSLEPEVVKVTGSGGKLFALGPNTLFQSNDGKDWQLAGNQFRGDLLGVAWGAGRWVAVGKNGRVQSSSDGEHWLFHEIGIEQDLVNVTWAGGRFIAYSKRVDSGCGTEPRCHPVIAVSANGQDWQISYPPTEIIMGITWGGGRFIVATFYDKFLTSTDGLTWQATAGRGSFFDDMRYWNGQFLGLESSYQSLKLYYSPDGQSWKYRPLPTDNRGEWRLIEVDGALVAYGDDVDFLLRSTDGNWWEQIPLPKGERLSKIVGAPGSWVALMKSSSPTLAYSTEMVHWAPTLVPPRIPGFAPRDVAGHDGQFLAVGVGGAVATLDTTQRAACVQIFPDVPPGHPACPAVATFMAKQSPYSFSAGGFNPDGRMYRIDFAQMLVEAMGWQAGKPAAPVSFTDYKASGVSAVSVAVAKGVMGGFADGTFRPMEGVTRAQLVKMAVAAAGLKPGGSPGYADVTTSAWFAGWVGAARSAKLIGKEGANPLWAEGAFDGDRLATRAEAVIIVANLMER